STVAATCTTVTFTVSAAPSALATTLAVPLSSARTQPLGLTVATVGSRLAHCTAAPATSLPFSSRSAAASCAESPSALNASEPGVTASVATSPAPPVPVGGSSPQASAPNSASASA